MINKIKNVFKLGKKIATISKKLIEVEFQGKKQPVLLYTPYGTFINPPNDLIVGLLADQGNEESLIGLVSDINNREELEEGEIAIGIPSQGARIYFRKNGNINFKIGDVEGGDFAVRFNELKAGFDELKQNFNDFVSSSYNVHTHIVTTPDTINGTASPTTSTGTPSTASIDDSKVEEIELPEL